MSSLTYILIYSEEYQSFFDTLPFGVLKILIDNTVASSFRIAKVPTLIVYDNLKEVDRLYGTSIIREKFNEMSINSR